MRRIILSLTFLPFAAFAEGETASSTATFLEGSFETAQTFTRSRKTCGQMLSCAEACHALLVCGDTRRDGDNDGIPCENLCSRRC